MVGINDATGKVVGGFEHVAQSLQILFTTPIASRVMRRLVGSAIPAILGRDLTAPTILKFKTALVIAIELWEPRYRVEIIYTAESDSADELRKGRVSLAIDGKYRPRGHLGDPTEEEASQRIIIGRTGAGALTVS